MIKLDNVSVTYNTGLSSELTALKNVNISFEPHLGLWTFIVGGNGSGKSTLLNILAKETKHNSGTIAYSKQERIMHLCQGSSDNLAPSMTIYENLILGNRGKGMDINLKLYDNKEARKEITSILKGFNLGLESKIDHQVRFLSGGEKQVVIACRILLFKPTILLMDEFTSALDQNMAPAILTAIKEYSIANNILTLSVTHKLEELGYGNRIIVLKGGEVIHDGQIDEQSISEIKKLMSA